jgi:hypothetical protein
VSERKFRGNRDRYGEDDVRDFSTVWRDKPWGLVVWSPSVVEQAKLIPHSGRSYGPDTPRQRHDDARPSSSDTAIEGSAQELATRYGLNQKTVAKWRKRSFLHDAPMGPRTPHSTSLRADEEAMVVTFRKHKHLPLDDCL